MRVAIFLFCRGLNGCLLSIHNENAETLRRIYYSRAAANKRDERALGSSENTGESALQANRGFLYCTN